VQIGTQSCIEKKTYDFQALIFGLRSCVAAVVLTTVCSDVSPFLLPINYQFHFPGSRPQTTSEPPTTTTPQHPPPCPPNSTHLVVDSEHRIKQRRRPSRHLTVYCKRIRILPRNENWDYGPLERSSSLSAFSIRRILPRFDTWKQFAFILPVNTILPKLPFLDSFWHL
jgi:hypothetical protein